MTRSAFALDLNFDEAFGSGQAKAKYTVHEMYAPAILPCLVLPAGSDFSNEEREGVLPIPIRLLASVNFYTVLRSYRRRRGQTAKPKLEVVLRRVADP
jgi:hypothetical protein